MDSERVSLDTPDGGLDLLREELASSRRYIRELERELAAREGVPLEPDLLNILSETAIGLVEMRVDADIFSYLSQRLSLLAPNSIVLVSEYLPEEDALVCRNVTGLGAHLDRVISLIGGSPVGQRFPINDEFARSEIMTGTLVKVVGGLHELSFGKIPKPITAILEALLNIGDIFVMGFCRAGVLMGNTVIISRRGQKIEKRIIETIGAQAAVTFQRQQAERERGEIRERLERARRLEVIGKMAGGIAHDFNSLLTGIIGYSELAQLDLDPSSPLLPYMKEIREAAGRASHLTYQLLAFSRKQILEPVLADFNEIVRRMQSPLANLLISPADLMLELADTPLPVRVDVREIRQVFLNLARNSRDAMPQRGEFRIRTALRVFETAQDFPERTLPAGRYAECVVSDTGEGIPPDMQSRIFEPFFTTKPVGRGLGLGLPMVHGIIHQHGGTVTLESTPGVGTRVRFLLALDGQDEPTDDAVA